MRVMCSGPSGGGCKMVICWNVNKSMDDLKHHSQLGFSTSGLQIIFDAPAKVQTQGQSDQIEPPSPDFRELGYSFSGSC